MMRIRIFNKFLLFLVYFQFSKKFYYRLMLVFVFVFQGIEAENF